MICLVVKSGLWRLAWGPPRSQATIRTVKAALSISLLREETAHPPGVLSPGLTSQVPSAQGLSPIEGLLPTQEGLHASWSATPTAPPPSL